MSQDAANRLPWLREIVEQGPRPLFATISGAHLYGFESADSDYDLRGAFVAPLDQVLRLRTPKETISILEVRDGLELDWVAHDVAKFARLMTKRNGYVLEQLFSPLTVHGGPWLDELRTIGEGCIIRHLHHHYSGFATNQRRLLEGSEPTVKRLLYCYRVLLTGIHVLQTGRIEANLPALNEEYAVPGIDELIERKRSGAEKSALDDGEAEGHRTALDALQEQLAAAFESSSLPDEVTSFDALDDFVVGACMELGRG
ncbi:MAG: nucleotidyltransferase domain-containing protein [Planctomycetota bacterium]